MLAIKQTASNTLHDEIKYLNLHTNNFCVNIASSIILLHYSNLTPTHASELVTSIFKMFNLLLFKWTEIHDDYQAIQGFL